MGRLPRQGRSRETRQKIFDAAMAAYASKGVDGATTEEIVTAAGVGWGTFFNFFPRKEDVLLVAAIEVQQDVQRAIAADVARGGTVGENIRAAYRALVAGVRPPALLAAVVREVLARGQRYEAMVHREGYAALWVAIADVLERGHQDGSVRAAVDARLQAKILHSAMLGVLARVGVPGQVGLPESMDLAALVDTTLDILWAGIGTVPVTPRRR